MKNLEKLFTDDEFLISKTDKHGIILYANENLEKISGYSTEELVGSPHNILRHPDMPKWAFEELWETIKSGKMWEGYVKNSSKEGDYYWVFAKVFPITNKDGDTEYISVRTTVRPEGKKEEMQKLYEATKNREY